MKQPEKQQHTKLAAYNKRFCEMAAVTPQTILWEIARSSPAASVVKPPLREAAGRYKQVLGQSVPHWNRNI